MPARAHSESTPRVILLRGVPYTWFEFSIGIFGWIVISTTHVE